MFAKLNLSIDYIVQGIVEEIQREPRLIRILYSGKEPKLLPNILTALQETYGWNLEFELQPKNSEERTDFSTYEVDLRQISLYGLEGNPVKRIVERYRQGPISENATPAK